MPQIITDGITEVEDGILLQNESGMVEIIGSYSLSEDFTININLTREATIYQLYRTTVENGGVDVIGQLDGNEPNATNITADYIESGKETLSWQHIWTNLASGGYTFKISHAGNADLSNGRHGLIILAQ